jgi:hypothetical protein
MIRNEQRDMKLWFCWGLAALVVIFLSAVAPAATQSSSVTPSISPAQINEICERYDVLARRVATAKEGLRSIKRQLAAEGLHLRGDILEAESRMQYRRDQAREAISHYDLESATQDLEIAEASVQSVERFLGR